MGGAVSNIYYKLSKISVPRVFSQRKIKNATIATITVITPVKATGPRKSRVKKFKAPITTIIPQLPKREIITPKFCFIATASLVHCRFGIFKFTASPNENEYYLTKTPAEQVTYYFNQKENLTTGTYKLNFMLYDGDTFIGDVYRYIIIR